MLSVTFISLVAFLGVFSALGVLPAFATGAGTLTCPLVDTITAGTTGNVHCTLSYANSDGSTITFATACAAGGPLFCTGWTIGAPTPASFTPSTGLGPFTEAVSFPVTAPTTCSSSGPNPCQISVQISASGGGLAVINGGTIVAVATVLISTPQFGFGIGVAAAFALLGLVLVKRRSLMRASVALPTNL